MTLQEQVKKVAQLREDWKALKVLHNGYYDNWVNQHKELIERLSLTGKSLQEAETDLRNEAVKAYAVDGNKHPVPEITIKEFEVLTYDMEIALKWASFHNIALKVDVPAFEKIAKASQLEFVTYRGEARAQIAQDLSHLKEIK